MSVAIMIKINPITIIDAGIIRKLSIQMVAFNLSNKAEPSNALNVLFIIMKVANPNIMLIIARTMKLIFVMLQMPIFFTSIILF